MKNLLFIIILLVLFISCSGEKQITQSGELNYSIKEDINKDIVESFYNNDTIGIGHKIYLLK